MNYLRTFGARGDPITALTWGLLVQSIVVVVLVSLAVILGIYLRRSRFEHPEGEREPLVRRSGGITFIGVGIALTLVALLGSTVWTVATLAAINDPPSDPPLTIAVRGQQWWWKVTYKGSPDQQFETANEIHIPVGEPVRLELTTGDVIHSFWVPSLGARMDLIPGQTNVTWMEANRPGIYRGQCAEYCGKQHAHMALRVVADPPDQFQKWRQNQLRPAAEPAAEIAAFGAERFLLRCGACHTVRGTPAGGGVGPDLTHLMSRGSIAADTLPNTPGHLAGWIADPQAIKPGNRMPKVDISGPELTGIRTYLETLR
ncbi:cytochrome c oxidase subunit II [Rhizobiales bacterium L72]|uniref:Cytochrome aa3 subunit 2 n=2 Tax=Propylenella binzhouense TaxID=2555902 RepID=A0A964T6Q5_9HYPH|nr:cytochrome c oxidase subunit II [Propylenella binzhouense]